MFPKADFPFLRKVTYFDSASSSPPPKQVIDQAIRFMSDYPVNYSVTATREGSAVANLMAKARRLSAELIDANPDEIVFTRNTSEGLSTVAKGLPLEEGDEVLMSDMEHPSNILPWVHLRMTRGIRIKRVPTGADGLVDPDEVRSRITARTRIVTVVGVSNVLGTIQPLREIGEVARDHGLWYLVDGAEVAGRIPFSVKEVGCHFASFCGRKGLCAPPGIGFLYVNAEASRDLQPFALGARSAKIVDPDGDMSLEYERPPAKYEAGVTNTLGAIGLGAAIEYFNSFGMDRIREHIGTLTVKAIQVLESIRGARVFGPRDFEHQGGILSWVIDGHDPAAVVAELSSKFGIVVRPRTLKSPYIKRKLQVDSTFRTSFHAFNDMADVELLVQKTKELIGDR
ncbi:MAG: aminotransferase class V-fold PLP-dependent enzyme [Bacillota bacterium]